MKTVYEAVVISQGGRDGHVKSTDGILDLPVSLPKSLGGIGTSTNPEQLFAAGYAACFESAVIHIARQRKQSIGKTQVKATVTLGTEASGVFKLAARLEVKIEGSTRDQTLSLVEAAHQICPYSNATRGNIEVVVEAA